MCNVVLHIFISFHGSCYSTPRYGLRLLQQSQGQYSAYPHFVSTSYLYLVVFCMNVDSLTTARLSEALKKNILPYSLTLMMLKYMIQYSHHTTHVHSNLESSLWLLCKCKKQNTTFILSASKMNIIEYKWFLLKAFWKCHVFNYLKKSTLLSHEEKAGKTSDLFWKYVIACEEISSPFNVTCHC